MRIIKLSKVAAEHRQDDYLLSDDPTETSGQPVAAVAESQEVAINVEAIRCFYPRRENKPGTRITFVDGGGFAVTQPYDEVLQLVQPN